MSKNAHPGEPHHYGTIVRAGRKYAICRHPRCTHFVEAVFAEGKESICLYCHKNFVMSRRALRLTRPHCGCRSLVQRKAEEKVKEIEDVLDRILPS